jgi:hypothetical protein
VCYGGSSVLLEARQRVSLVESGGIGIHVRCVPRQRRQIRSTGLLSRLFLFASLFWSLLLLEHEVYNKHSALEIWLGQWWWKELGGDTGWFSASVLANDDDFYLQNPTTALPSFSLKIVVIVVLLILVCLLWKKLWARVLIVSVMVRLDLCGIIMVTRPLTATLVWVIYIYVLLL